MLGLAAAVMLQAAGVAPAAVTPVPQIFAPDWIRRPTGNDLARVFPPGAYRRQLSGRANLECRVTSAGTLADCIVAYEEPAGEGFGAAGLRMAPLFLMRPQTKDGQPVDGGTVRIPLRFIHPNAPMDAYSVITACYGEASAQVERKPADSEAARAAVYYQSLANQLAVERNIDATTMSSVLSGTKLAALTPGPDYSPGLARCMTIYREQVAKSAKAPD